MLGDLAVAHAHDVDGVKVDASTGRRHTQECSPARAMRRLGRRHQLPIGGLPMELGSVLAGPPGASGDSQEAAGSLRAGWARPRL